MLRIFKRLNFLRASGRTDKENGQPFVCQDVVFQYTVCWHNPSTLFKWEKTYIQEKPSQHGSISPLQIATMSPSRSDARRFSVHLEIPLFSIPIISYLILLVNKKQKCFYRTTTCFMFALQLHHWFVFYSFKTYDI